MLTATNQSTGKTRSLVNNLMNNDSDGHTTFVEVGQTVSYKGKPLPLTTKQQRSNKHLHKRLGFNA